MEFQLIIKGGTSHHPLEGSDPHVRHILEAHVKSNHRNHGIDDLVGEAEALHDAETHLGTDTFMPIEADASRLIDKTCRGFSQVMEEHREHKRQ